MSGDFIFMQILAVCGSAQDRELLRQGATLASLPIEFTALSATAAARAALSKDQIDILFVDHALAEQDRDFIAAARAARQPPFVVLVAEGYEQVETLRVPERYECMPCGQADLVGGVFAVQRRDEPLRIGAAPLTEVLQEDSRLVRILGARGREVGRGGAALEAA